MHFTYSDLADVRAVVYGLSTEGYQLASAMAVKDVNVSMVDEAKRMAFTLRPEVARTYPNVNSLMEDEPLLGLEPEQKVIGDSGYLFFAPRIRKTGQDVKSDILTKFRDAIAPIKKGATVVFNLPVGVGGNGENIALAERVTGLAAESDLKYYYMPIGPEKFELPFVGSPKARADPVMAKFLHDYAQKKLKFLDMNSAEFMHAIRVLSHYSSLASIFEMCRYIADPEARDGLQQEELREIYFDDIASGLFDMRVLASSLEGGGSLTYLVNGTIKSTEGYVKNLIDQVRDLLKRRELKASRTRVAIAWTLDSNEIRGDKLDLLALLENKLRDYIGDVERYQPDGVDLYQGDKTTVTIACSKQDYETVAKAKTDAIILKANPLCEVV